MTTAANLEMKANPSIIDENSVTTTRMVTKQDGSQVPFSEQTLRAYLEVQLAGLNSEYISIDIIIGKVISGLYNGKSLHPRRLPRPAPSLTFCLVSQFWLQEGTTL